MPDPGQGKQNSRTPWWCCSVNPEGRIYVGDRIGATVRVYSGSGQHIEAIAKEGGGPGEISGWPADLTTDSDGNLYVRGDTVRVIHGPAQAALEIPVAEHADSTRTLDARLDTLPVPIDDVGGLGEGVRERRLSSTLGRLPEREVR